MSTPPSATSRRLMAYRIAASGLDRRTPDVHALDIWDLGLQDRDGSARVALAARLAEPLRARWLTGPGAELAGEPAGDSPFAMAWSLRGSPHLHRRADLQRFADALWPRDEADALVRLVGSGKRLTAQGATGLAGYAAVGAAMRSVAGSRILTKSELSTAVTAQVASGFAGLCEPCGSVHVFEMLFRVAALPGGLGLLPAGRATLQRLAPTLRQPTAPRGLDAVAASYLRIFGVGTASEVAAYLGTSAASLKRAGTLPAELQPMLIDGIQTSATPAEAAAILTTEPESAAGIVRLLAPGDPLLQPRERSLTISDRAAWKQLWPAIGPAGAVLAGGEIAGYWRGRKAGNALTITVGAFRRLSPGELSAIDAEAQLVGAVRGATDARVSVTSAATSK